MRSQLFAFGEQVEPEHLARATRQRNEAGTQPQQRRLAGAIRTAHPHDLATLDVQRGAGEGWEPSEHGDRIAELDDGVHHWRTLPAVPCALHGPHFAMGSAPRCA